MNTAAGNPTGISYAPGAVLIAKTDVTVDDPVIQRLLARLAEVVLSTARQFAADTGTPTEHLRVKSRPIKDCSFDPAMRQFYFDVYDGRAEDALPAEGKAWFANMVETVEQTEARL